MFKRLSETLAAYQARDPAARSKLEIFCCIRAYTPSSSPGIPLAVPAQAVLSGPAQLPAGPAHHRH